MNEHYPPEEKPFSSIEKKSVHFIGVLGIGVSSLAQWFLAQNWAVSGSDSALNPVYQELKKAGLKAKIGQKKTNIPRECGLVIYSQAIKPENPEIQEARTRNIPVMSYPEALGELTGFHKTICISGMHGKSTTTAMAGLTLAKAKMDPMMIIGTRLKELGGKNFRYGGGCLVLEADEYKGAFLKYSPSFVITTNIDREHLDYFKNAAKIKKTFLEFYSRTARGGTLILNKDNEMLFSLQAEIEKIRKDRNLNVVWYSIKENEAEKIKKVIGIPGEHNLSNALSVFHLAKSLGIKENVFLSSISSYKGSWRRMEERGRAKIKGISPDPLVYDDYGHHPSEIKATLSAFREKFPDKKIICVFQPHQAERLKLLFKEFKTAFDGADRTIILPVYMVAGRESAAGGRYDSDSLVSAIQKMKPPRQVFYLAEPKKLKNALAVLLSERSFPCPAGKKKIPEKRKNHGSVIVMMGAGNIVNYTDSLIGKK